jgi:hypothetical protein
MTPGFNFNVEEWFEGDRCETLAICRTLDLAHAAFAVAIAEKPAGRFMIRSRARGAAAPAGRPRYAAPNNYARLPFPAQPSRPNAPRPVAKSGTPDLRPRAIEGSLHHSHGTSFDLKGPNRGRSYPRARPAPASAATPSTPRDGSAKGSVTARRPSVMPSTPHSRHEARTVRNPLHPAGRTANERDARAVY